MKMNPKLFYVLAGTSMVLAACGGEAAQPKDDERVIIYSNADDEAVAVLKKALDDKGYKDRYVIQSMGTSELGGKLMAEGTKIEADIITMASYFLESAQQKNTMFKDMKVEQVPVDDYGTYQMPMLGNAGAIFVNTKALEAADLPAPKSIKDLADPIYKGQISFPNIMDSSTAWLLIQGILNEYGEKEGKSIIADLKQNAGPHIESSGSGPIKKVKAGEVAIGFGLRNQAVQANTEGMPIEVVDPLEGNFTLTESISVVNKDEMNSLTEKIAQTMATEAREAMLAEYPVVLYQDETLPNTEKAANFKRWDTTLTVELLEQHQAIFNEAQ
ncbi:hypothetical protein GCM10007425_13730 [Lysinibacillus alkalisoli]|uniref:Extracellular solute-binding protein n=1 Tax=Lysinibacillus alkalisoli TaxID=1911548 RepID=A0A917G2Y9_9BACI|nr:extracellular solute-binding protein [Lysinibacillus alkalisoli]GGG20548.1 hypothetical protein GCM10007425_13730 [Lysinibacillus alkalisoli]